MPTSRSPVLPQANDSAATIELVARHLARRCSSTYAMTAERFFSLVDLALAGGPSRQPREPGRPGNITRGD